MNYYQAIEFFNKLYAGKIVKYEFDDSCYNTIELSSIDGKANPTQNVECQQLKVNVDGQDPLYVPIETHIYNIPWKEVVEFVNKQLL